MFYKVERNQIKLTYKGQKISIVQHWCNGESVVQECANIDNYDHIYGFRNDLDSLIQSLELLRAAINAESNNA
jgi:hypothetical protein